MAAIFRTFLVCALAREAPISCTGASCSNCDKAKTGRVLLQIRRKPAKHERELPPRANLISGLPVSGAPPNHVPVTLAQADPVDWILRFNATITDDELHKVCVELKSHGAICNEEGRPNKKGVPYAVMTASVKKVEETTASFPELVEFIEAKAVTKEKNATYPPNFIIVGCMKCGSTSLFRYISLHPRFVAPSCAAAREYKRLHEHSPVYCWLDKELHFFENDATYRLGMDFYQDFFPLYAMGEEDAISGEATPNYIFSPNAAERIAANLPRVKIIVSLRDPAARAFSHHRFFLKMKAHGWPVPVDGPPWKSFNQLPGVEEVTVGNASLDSGDVAMLRCLQRPNDAEDRPGGCSSRWEYCNQELTDGKQDWKKLLDAYVSLGIYAPQLEMWQCYFPSTQLLVLRSEDMFSRPRQVLRLHVAPFLGLQGDVSQWSASSLSAISTNSGNGDGQDLEILHELTADDFATVHATYHREPIAPIPQVVEDERLALTRLRRFYAKWNSELYRMTGPEFGTWESESPK